MSLGVFWIWFHRREPLAKGQSPVIQAASSILLIRADAWPTSARGTPSVKWSITYPRAVIPAPCERRERRGGRPHAGRQTSATMAQYIFRWVSMEATSPSPVSAYRYAYNA